MLYNKNWDKKQEELSPKGYAKHQHYDWSLSELVAWLEAQPPEKTYPWFSVHGCALCQFLQEQTGWKSPAGNLADGFGSHTIRDWGGDGYHKILGAEPWTFGAALERARSALALHQR